MEGEDRTEGQEQQPGEDQGDRPQTIEEMQGSADTPEGRSVAGQEQGQGGVEGAPETAQEGRNAPEDGSEDG